MYSTPLHIPDSELLVAADINGTVRMVSLGEEETAEVVVEEALSSKSFFSSPKLVEDSRKLVIGNRDGTLRCLSVDSGSKPLKVEWTLDCESAIYIQQRSRPR
jgi:hypothetical protein